MSIETYELAKLDHTNQLFSNLNFKRKQEQLNNSMLVFVSFYTQIGFYAYIHRFLCTMKLGHESIVSNVQIWKKKTIMAQHFYACVHIFLCSLSYVSMLKKLSY